MSRKLLPFAPADMPDVWIGGNDVIPCKSGAYAPPSLFQQKVGAGPASPGTTLRAWCALLPDDTAVGYIGTTTKLWQYDGVTTFTDKSKGGGYTNTATDWSFAQFGNYSIATNRVDAVQVRDASGAAAFADLAGTPPKARIVVTQSDAVLLFDLNDGAEKGNAFAASAPGDHTDWSGASAMTATAIRHRPGKITAAVAFRDYVLVFKRSSVYRISYTGSTYKWKVELIAIGRGAYGKHNVVNCGDIVVFSGPGGAWTFDGASFNSIADLFGDISTSTASYFSPISRNAYFCVSNATHKSYNILSDRWGSVIARTATASLGSTAGVFLTGEPAALATFSGDTVGVTYPDVMWFIGLSNNPCVLKSDLVYGGGTPYSGSASYLYGSIDGLAGKGYPADQVTRFTRLWPKFTTPFTTAVANTPPGNTELTLNTLSFGSILDLASPTTSADITSSTAQRRFDFNLSVVAMYPKISFDNNSGYLEISDYTLSMEPAGTL